ncbi:MAG: Tad domain-containing protein [Anaerolineales bacterium]
MKKTFEKAQALILIAIGMFALLAITAVAVDGGNVLRDRRQAQNAADTAALAAALAITKNNPNWSQDALDRAASNGYLNDGTRSLVEVHRPPVNGPYAGNNEYVQVIITSHVPTYFANIVGFSQITNRVQAVARARPPQALFNGNAVVGLAPTECKAVEFQGNANMTINGNGIFVNSSCSCDQTAAFFNNSGSGTLVTPYIQSVGCVKYKEGAVQAGSIQWGSSVPPFSYPPAWLPPIPACDYTWGNLSGSHTLQPGVHCVNGNFTINANDSLSGNGVTFVVYGEVRWNGGTVNLSAPTSGPTAGLLLYLPITNNNPITFNGNASWNIRGTILAPASDITVNGTEDGFSMRSQLIGYTVKLTGGGNTSITYNDSENIDQPPMIELSR